MHNFQTTIKWERNGQVFVDNRYSRAHEWQFDGGFVVPASSAPDIVPLPLSIAENVDPEEAFVASVASCHMLFFLSLAAKSNILVDAYIDNAVACMGNDADDNTCIATVTLRPAARYGDGIAPSRADIEALHHRAHRQCFIANSIKSAITVEIQS